MPEEPLEAMTLLLVPLPWPMMLILSVALGVLAYVVLENSRHFRDTQLKEVSWDCPGLSPLEHSSFGLPY